MCSSSSASRRWTVDWLAPSILAAASVLPPRATARKYRRSFQSNTAGLSILAAALVQTWSCPRELLWLSLVPGGTCGHRGHCTRQRGMLSRRRDPQRHYWETPMQRLTATVAWLVLVSPALCADTIVGTWRIESFVREVTATGQRYNEFGDKPSGYISYLPDGRMHAMLVADN